MATLLWATMVVQDALGARPPVLGLTLTTAKAQTPPGEFRAAVADVRRLVRNRVGRVEELGHIEFTTGLGTRSGGHRRIHQHGLLKPPPDVPAAQLLALEDDVRAVWRRHTGANRIELAELRTAAGAAHYLTHHHGKRAQLPPAGWRGRRYRPTRGYFDGPAAERREEAQTLLLDARLVRSVRASIAADVQLQDAPDDVVDELLRRDLDRARALAAAGAQLVRVQEVPVEFGADGLPSRWDVQVLGRANEVE